MQDTNSAQDLTVVNPESPQSNSNKNAERENNKSYFSTLYSYIPPVPKQLYDSPHTKQYKQIIKQSYNVLSDATNATVKNASTYGTKMYDYFFIDKQNAQDYGANASNFPQFVMNGTQTSYLKICSKCIENGNEHLIDKTITFLTGFRLCAGCQRCFCVSHCSYKKPVKEDEPNAHWVFVCQRCFEKSQAQSLGQTRDCTSTFHQIRSKRFAASRTIQKTRLQNLAKLSQEAVYAQVSRQEVKPQQQASYTSSLWNLSTTVTSAVKTYTTTVYKGQSDSGLPAPSSSDCNYCRKPLGWSKQTCKLCNCAYCTECCNINMPLGKSIFNPNGPTDLNADITICKPCYKYLEQAKKEAQMRMVLRSEQIVKYLKLYDDVSKVKKEIDAKISKYVEYSQLVNSTLITEFELLDVEENEANNSTNNVELDVTEERIKMQYLLKELLGLFEAYQKGIQALINQNPCDCRSSQVFLKNLKASYVQSQANMVLSPIIMQQQQ